MNEPAFPSHYEIVVGSRLEENEKVLLRSKEGMTLRDYFAGQALMGLCAFTGGTEDIYPRRFNDGVANECYQIADAMLEARKK